MEDYKRNGSGYIDTTAYKAIKSVSDEERKVSDLVKTLRSVAQLAGFEIEGRITLINKKSGREWR
jgi:hypothetical protein